VGRALDRDDVRQADESGLGCRECASIGCPKLPADEDMNTNRPYFCFAITLYAGWLR
jgi:hypothetical protein